MRTINHWINGQTVATSAERTGAVYDPATGQQAAQVAYATGEDVDAAVRAAQDAFPAWRDTSIVKRARVMFAFRDLLEKHRGAGPDHRLRARQGRARRRRRGPAGP